jgi:ribosomal protein S18 acetylase RimI-like enzyme
MITVRQAGPDDVASIARLFRGVQSLHVAQHPDEFKPPAADDAERAWLAEVVGGPTARTWLAETAGIAAGYLLAQEVRREESVIRPPLRFLLIEHIGVAPEHQKRGIGTALMRAVFEEAAALGIGRVKLDVWRFNEEARRFFARRGFATLHERMEAKLPSDGGRGGKPS